MFEPIFILSTLICNVSVEGKTSVHDKVLQSFTLFNQRWAAFLKWCSQLRWAAIALVAAVGGSKKRHNSSTKSLAVLPHSWSSCQSSIFMKISRAVMKCFFYVNIWHLNGLRGTKVRGHFLWEICSCDLGCCCLRTSTSLSCNNPLECQNDCYDTSSVVPCRIDEGAGSKRISMATKKSWKTVIKKIKEVRRQLTVDFVGLQLGFRFDSCISGRRPSDVRLVCTLVGK